ncbi:ABC transporter ATP-binding protein [Holdemanella sp. MSK.7.32]|uniref:ATP-binding cassette domain-containing protein n=1 Tax=Holdemanella sp. MSK.7.32 TaxID=2965273 RepID=UPI00210BCB10|nr:ABC transporter ATP-binding protein [Holdemanella sp. MSK.7.32]MCQ4804062.1 ABC transporter ATP-binding protein/permease [Holdemanella sp. MSK.7.32]
MKKIKVFYKNVFYAIKYIYKIDKSYIFLEFLNVILTAFSSIFSVYSLKVLLDVFVQKKINVLTIMLFIIFTISIIVDYLQNKIEKQSIELKKIIMSERTNFDLYNSILNKNVLIFEDKEYYDKIYLNMTQGLSNILSLQNNLGKLLTQILSIIGIGSIVIQYDFRIIVLVLIVVLFSVMLNFYQAKLDFKKNIDSIYPSRIFDYTTRTVYLKQYSKELRKFKIFEVIKAMYKKSVDDIYHINEKYAKKSIQVTMMQDILEFILQFCTIIILFFKYIVNEILISDFLVLYNSTMDLCLYIKSIFNIIPDFYQNSLYISEFKEIIESKKSESDNDCLNNYPFLLDSLKLENISFSFKNRRIIDNFNYEFQNNKIYLIQGKNGAGKSTLLNIICGLYKTACGDIYINGVIKAEQKWLKENVNVMFQDGQLYALPLIYNIIMRPIQNKDADEKLVWDLLDKVGIASKIQKLPLTIYTPISNELDDYGTSFSGGETQKILLARSLANTKLINIYDEVSNALDVESKKDAVKLIRKYNKNTITIVVSHDNEWNDYVDQIVKL